MTISLILISSGSGCRPAALACLSQPVMDSHLTDNLGHLSSRTGKICYGEDFWLQFCAIIAAGNNYYPTFLRQVRQHDCPKISEDYCFSRESTYFNVLQETNCSFICILAEMSVKKLYLKVV